MKKNNFFKLLIPAFIFFFFFGTNKTYASIPIGTGEDCTTSQDCLREYGMGTCINRVCVTTQNDILEFQREVEAGKNGNPNLSWFSSEVFGKVADAGVSEIFGNIPEGETSQSYVPGGVIGSLGKMLSSLYAIPPASGGEYIASIKRDLGVVSPAYAQGIGFEGLRPVLEIWKTFRNISYIFFALIALYIGFAIMFRLKLDPRTVISIQNSLPKLVVAFLLITFSYAIAGLLIDLSYILMFIIMNTVGEITFGRLEYDGFADFTNFLTGRTYDNNNWFFVGRYLAQVILLTVGSLPKILPILLFPVARLIFGAIIIYVLLKILYQVLVSYVNIVLLVIFAPFQLLVSALPGNKDGTKWFRNLIANIAVVPTILTMFLLAGYFLSFDAFNFSSENALDVIEATWESIRGIFTADGAFASIQNVLTWAATQLIGFGLFVMIPKVTDMVKYTLQIKGYDFPSAIGETMSGAYERSFGKEASKYAQAQRLYESNPWLYPDPSTVGAFSRFKGVKDWFGRMGAKTEGGRK